MSPLIIIRKQREEPNAGQHPLSGHFLESLQIFSFSVNTQACMSLACRCCSSDWTLDTESSQREKIKNNNKTGEPRCSSHSDHVQDIWQLNREKKRRVWMPVKVLQD